MVGAKTRFVDLVGGQKRGDGLNRNTLFAGSSEWRFPFDLTFRRVWDAIRPPLTLWKEPGVAVFAVHATRGLEAGGWFAAKTGQLNAAMIGRHDRTDLYLASDPGLSLRHLALLIEPITSYDGDVRYRVVDLRTPTAFEDEEGRRLESIVAEGPVFVRCGQYVLFFLTTGDGNTWPEDWETAWRCIPERVYLQENQAEPDRWQRPRAGADASNKHRRITFVTLAAGPVAALDPVMSHNDVAVARLELASGHKRAQVVLGHKALEQGVILGCYPRCDAAHVLANEGISRVHLLFVRVADRVWAIDTASTNGTFVRDTGRSARAHPLGPGTELVLGDNLAHLRWVTVQ